MFFMENWRKFYPALSLDFPSLQAICYIFQGLAKLKREIAEFEKEKTEELKRLEEFKKEEMKKLK